MEWIKLTPENEPKGEALFANFKEGTYGYEEKIIGYCGNVKEDGTANASNDHEELENVTHFIDINKFDIK